MRVVVTGASGLLGRAVQARLSSEQHEVLALANSRATPPLVQLDLLDTDALRKTLQDFKPDVIVHAAAERRPDVVEKEPERSQELNVDVPGRIAEICRDLGTGSTRLIYISTDYVFDGSKPPYKVDSEPNPLNAYGTSKLLGERAVAEKGKQGHVTSLRVPVLYGPAGHPSESAVNILQTTILPPSDGRTIKMDAYAVRYPTNVQDVAKVIAQIAHQAVVQGKELPPILHFQATEAMTKYDMCNVMSRLQNRNAPPLPETSVSHLDPECEIDVMATPRPRHCKMDTSVLQDFGVDVAHVSFEEWWSEEMTRQAGEEQERQRKKREEEEQRRLEEEERRRQEEKERLEEERRLHEQQEAKRREEKEEERRLQEETERARKAEEDEAVREKAKEAEQNDVQRPDEGGSSQEVDSKPDPGVHSPTGPSTDSTASVPSSSSKPTTASPEQRAATPSSPNPSFSSLRARPTPPGSSARSPSTSQPPSLRNAEGVVPPLDEQAPPPVPAKRAGDMSRSSSQSRAGDSATATPQSSQTIRSNPFRTESPRPANLETGDAIKAASRSKAGDDDEDPYGEPSPRPGGDEERDQNQDAAQKPKDGSARSSAFKEGYGEVRFGLGDKSQEGEQAKETQTQSSHEASQPSFLIKVGDPHKVGDAMTGHIVYTVRTQTRAQGFKASTFSSLRRYNDFRWLHAALVHNNPGIIIPPVPEKVRGLISRFSPDLVEARRHGLEICVNKIANHPVLAKDEDLKLFLESEDFSRDVKLRDARKGPVPTPEQKTWMGWSGTVGVNSGHKFVEYDEWFDQQKAYLDALEAQLKGMVKSINALSQSRKELADCIAASSHSLLMLSGSSLSRSLSACFAGLGDLQRRAQELEDLQSDSDVRHFGSVLYEYERVVGSVRKAFSTRIDCWHLTQKADDDLRRTRTKHEKLKREPAANHYYEESLKDLAEAEDRALERRAELDKVSRRCKEEMKRFDREKVDDLRRAMDQWLEGQIERREELLEEWIDYSQKCLSLDLRSDEEKQRDRERAPRQQQEQGVGEVASQKDEDRREDQVGVQTEGKRGGASSTAEDTNGKTADESKANETVAKATDNKGASVASTQSEGESGTDAGAERADEGSAGAEPSTADESKAGGTSSAVDSVENVQSGTPASGEAGDDDDSAAPAEKDATAPQATGGSLEEANGQEEMAAAASAVPQERVE